MSGAHFATPFLALVAACGTQAPDLSLEIREPADHTLFSSVTGLDLRADRGGRTIAEAHFSPTARYVSLSDVRYGADTVVTLDGLNANGDVVAAGSTCALNFVDDGSPAALYFAPLDLFAATPGAPPGARALQMPIMLAAGDVLFAGGLENGKAVASTFQYRQSAATFVETMQALPGPRAGAEASVLSMGTLLTGGVDDTGAPLGSATLYLASSGTFLSIENSVLGARSAHRAIVIPTDRVVLTGGFDATGRAQASTSVVIVQGDGTAQVTAGPPLVEARAAHAAVVSIGTPVVIGGYDVNHQPLASIEALSLADDGDILNFSTIAQLAYARAEATATLLGDGSILVVGGIGQGGQPRGDAEVYDPITESTRVYSLASARSGHTATLLPDGSVLIVGGVGSDGQPINVNELFIVDMGFVSELPLLEARSDHLAVPLCDGTVLIEGGASDAELYTPAP